jgi:hypothetical protein
MTTDWQTADGLHVDTLKKEEKGRPGVKWTKEIYYDVAEEGLDKYNGNGWRKVATRKRKKSLKLS